MYIGGGWTGDSVWTKSVLVCEVGDLLQSTTSQPLTPAHTHHSLVWREIAELPVVRSSLISFQGQLLAIGGQSGDGATSDVRQYNATINSWSVIGHMRMKRYHSLAAVLPNNTLMVVGGRGEAHRLQNNVEIATVFQ